jgi:CspA family cold shock protein
MAGHPSVKKRQKEMLRKERQAEKLVKRDERRLRRNDPSQPLEAGATEAWPFDADGAPIEPAPREAPPLLAGNIKRLTDKGFGFIETDSGNDLFFHSSVVQGAVFEQLQVGQRVEFAEGQGPKGPRAEAVRPVVMENTP